MNRVFAYLGRFAVIILGYLAASLAASAFINIIALASMGFTSEEAPAVVTGSLVFSIPFVALFVAYFAFIPAVAAILLCELTSRRDWLYYALAGAIVAVIVISVIRGAAEASNQAVTDPRYAMAIIGGGIVGGMAYWLVSGRYAGNWRERTGSNPILPGPSGS